MLERMMGLGIKLIQLLIQMLIQMLSETNKYRSIIYYKQVTYVGPPLSSLPMG